jgi:putative colanic acid biosynthesis UDP-glucose lipid carrier transferase
MLDTAPSVDRQAVQAALAAQAGVAQASGHQATVHYLTPPAALPATENLPVLPVAASATKRLADVMFASLALLMFLPLLLVIAIAVRLESRGPALFRQRRTGLNGKVFTIFKFRTMTVAEDGGEIRHATKNDARITQLGLVLRKCSLDELPQLINILRGDMSVVGPRPHAISHDEYYGARIATYNQRFRARPGLTGNAQVKGFRGEVHELQCMMDRVGADNDYIDHWSLGRDLWIMLCTVPLVFRDPNAY